jgi:hypothetical protein
MLRLVAVAGSNLLQGLDCVLVGLVAVVSLGGAALEWLPTFLEGRARKRRKLRRAARWASEPHRPTSSQHPPASWPAQLAITALIWPLFAWGCACDAFVLADGRYPGWFALFMGVFEPLPWSANLFFFVGWGCVLTRQSGGALGCGVLAVLTGLTSCGFVRELLVGYYLWQASLVTLALGAWLWHLQQTRHDEPG